MRPKSGKPGGLPDKGRPSDPWRILMTLGYFNAFGEVRPDQICRPARGHAGA